MYRKADDYPKFPGFALPFDGKLDTDNRWIRLAKLIPWDRLEELYGSKFSTGVGRPAKSVRLAGIHDSQAQVEPRRRGSGGADPRTRISNTSWGSRSSARSFRLIPPS